MNILSKKECKRKNIAKSCCDIFVKHGFNEISISQIASTAGIGKGTVYEYFHNKEEIVCELMDCLEDSYNKEFYNNLNNKHSKQDKLLSLFDIFVNDDAVHQTRREIYKQFLIICLTKPSHEVKMYNTKLRNKYISVINEIVSNDIVATRIYDTVIGFFVAFNSIDEYDLKEHLSLYIKNELKQIGETNE